MKHCNKVMSINSCLVFKSCINLVLRDRKLIVEIYEIGRRQNSCYKEELVAEAKRCGKRVCGKEGGGVKEEWCRKMGWE